MNDGRITIKTDLDACFNRYMVECESIHLIRVALFEPVLIDTWWNVNQALEKALAMGGMRFNRYMVECEYCCDI